MSDSDYFVVVVVDAVEVVVELPVVAVLETYSFAVFIVIAAHLHVAQQ